MTPDAYSLGGVVEALEEQFARILGKERAIFMPTGTLANHMAVRALAGGPSRVIVQEDSHFYQDEGDCAQTLSNLTLMPLAPGRASFTADDVQHVLDQTKGARVVSRVSVIAIETPVRRKQGERFDPAEMKKIVALARREGIRLHLDGARLFLQAAYTGESVADYARPFDTVYVSLYKYFNAASGAILAGPKELHRRDVSRPAHVRRRSQHRLAVRTRRAHYLPASSDRFRTAVRTSEDWIAACGSKARSPSSAFRWARTCSVSGEGGRPGRVSETAGGTGRDAVLAAARQLSGGRERDAEPYDRRGIDRRVRARACRLTPPMATVVTGQANIGVASLYYEMTGAGSPVVLLHGLDLDHRMWDEQVAPLAHAHTVVRYDLRGSGRSTGAGHGSSHAEDLKALLDHLELVGVSLLGFSLGGGAALDFAVAYPDAVRALILVNPSIEGPAAARLGDVTAPTLVAVGELDTQDAREMASTLEAGIPDAWKVMIPSAGRTVNLDDPKRFNEIVMAFLAETERKSRR